MPGTQLSARLSIVVMGVAGCGKSTIAQAIASRLDAEFIEGDNLHPDTNIAKMRSGRPLNDDDRRPWLEAVGRRLGMAGQRGTPTVAACSALRRSYRDILRATAGTDLTFIFLDGPPALIRARLTARKGHFMLASLLDTQLRTLERPMADECWIAADLTMPSDVLVERVLGKIDAARGAKANAVCEEGDSERILSLIGAAGIGSEG